MVRAILIFGLWLCSGDHPKQDDVGIVRAAGKLESQSVIALRNNTGVSLPIIQLVPEGTMVKEGDLVAQLDDAKLKEQLAQQTIVMINARTNLIEAEADRKAVKLELEAAIALAKMRLELATKNQQRILGSGGELDLQLKAAQNEAKLAQQELRLAEQRLQSLERENAAADETSEAKLEIEAAKAAVDLAMSEIKLLEGPEHDYRTAMARLEVLEAELELQQAENGFKFQDERTNAQWQAAQKALLLQEEKRERLEKQIQGCQIQAPQKGKVSYAHVYNRSGGGVFVVEPGAVIRHRQTIAQIPDMSALQVNVMIKESSIKRVRVGQPATIRIDAVGDKVLEGKVSHVTSYPDPASWQQRDAPRMYSVKITIEKPPENIQLGMTAQVHIDTTE